MDRHRRATSGAARHGTRVRRLRAHAPSLCWWAASTKHSCCAWLRLRRVHYDQTLKDLRGRAASKLGVSGDKLELYFQGRELVPNLDDAKTLLEMGLHTGFGLQGYDLSVEPAYWPPVRQTAHGKVVCGPGQEE